MRSGRSRRLAAIAAAVAASVAAVVLALTAGVSGASAGSGAVTMRPVPAVARPVRIEVKTAKPLPERRHVRPVALVAGGAVALACVGLVLGALRR